MVIQYVLVSLLSGLLFPRVAAVLNLLWCYGRFQYQVIDGSFELGNKWMLIHVKIAGTIHSIQEIDRQTSFDIEESNLSLLLF